MRNQPSKKAMMISAVLTALILIGMAGVNLSKQGYSLALANPLQIEQVSAAPEMAPEVAPEAALDVATAQDAVLASGTALDPALEVALDAALDPDMDPALKDSLKSALRSALAPQNLTALKGQAAEPAFVVTVEPIFMPGQQQAAVSGASSGGWSAPAAAAPAAAAPSVSSSNDQVAAAYQAQLEEAYAALQDAYTQIDTLQSAPATTVSYAGGYDDDEGEHEEHHEDHDDDDDDGDHDEDDDDHGDHDEDDD